MILCSYDPLFLPAVILIPVCLSAEGHTEAMGADNQHHSLVCSIYITLCAGQDPAKGAHTLVRTPLSNLKITRNSQAHVQGASRDSDEDLLTRRAGSEI